MRRLRSSAPLALVAWLSTHSASAVAGPLPSKVFCVDVNDVGAAIFKNGNILKCNAEFTGSLLDRTWPMPISEADRMCTFASCRDAFTTMRGFNRTLKSDCIIFGDNATGKVVLLVRDVLTPLSNSPQCANATDGQLEYASVSSPPPLPPPVPRPKHPHSGLQTAAIVGIVLGVVAVLAIGTVIAIIIYKRRQESPQKPVGSDRKSNDNDHENAHALLSNDLTAPLTSPVNLPKPSAPTATQSSLPVPSAPTASQTSFPVPSAPTASQTSLFAPSAPTASQTSMPVPSASTASQSQSAFPQPSAPTATASVLQAAASTVPTNQITMATLMDELSHDDTFLARSMRAEDIQDIRVIGSGGHGIVYLVRYRRTQLLASKRLVQDRMTPPKLQAFIDEIKLVAQLEHPCIVAFIGTAWTNEYDLQALFAYMPNGDLCTYLAKTNQRDPHQGWDSTKLQIALDVVHALVYVHSFSPPLVHRDLKSRNVLLDSDHRGKLSDFGVSRYQSDALTMTTGVGTSRWLAPEVISGGGEYNERCDIYSFGMVLVELDTHSLPFSGLARNSMAEMNLLQLVSEGKLQPTFRETCPASMVAVARKCLAYDPALRPTAMEVAYALRTIATDEFQFRPLH